MCCGHLVIQSVLGCAWQGLAGLGIGRPILTTHFLLVAQESKQQQEDENARLRRTLEEWSLANRKLEVEVGRWKKAASEASAMAAAAAAEAAGQRQQEMQQLQPD